MKKQPTQRTLSIKTAAATSELPPTEAQSKQASPGSKIANVVALLEREAGATLDEIITTTGWLPHTTRAALTGIRKRGWSVERFKRDELTCYRVTGKA